jgi:phytoene dehydrogenase-like protein/NAD-dependent dihydropyrimidine dehydrogenase PreA subunit
MSIQVEKQSCTGCGYCSIICHYSAISLKIEETSWPIIDEGQCVLCGDCIYGCPNQVFSDLDIKVPTIPLQDHYDVIIIGAGIGGLMTGAGLARAGKSVLILEQLSFTGGKYTQLLHHSYAVSTAAWTCPGPNSRIGRLCKKLGADIHWITIHDVKSTGEHWVVTKDGRKFPTLNETQETLIGGRRGMRRVYRWIADMYDPRVSYPDDMTTRQYIQKFIPDNEEYTRYVETIITHCFASQTVDNFSAMETRRAVVDSLEQMADWGTAIGGTSAIVAGVEQVFRDHGGEIATRTRVASIDLKDGKATGVTLADGRVISAGIVIHNAGLNRLIGLVGEKNLPPQYLSRLKQAVPANVAALILGTTEPLLQQDHSLLHAMGWERILNCYAPTFFDPSLAPQGKHLLDVFWAMQSPYDQHQELELVLAQLRQIFPNFDQVVEIKIPMFFTGSWTAEMAHRIGQSGKDRLDPRSPIENLYLVGYDCIGYGMAGDIIPHGVEKALYLILNDPAYKEQDEKASKNITRWLKSLFFKGLALVSSL